MAVYEPIEGERWAKIDGFDYEISDLGRVRRVGRQKPLRLSAMPTGYPIVYLSRDGKRNCRIVHRLVAMAFIPERDGAVQVNHKNGTKSDNRAANLEWVTNTENRRHASAVLHVQWGERSVLARFSNAEVATMRAEYDAGRATARGLSADHGVSRSCMWAILTRRTYKEAG